MFKILKWLTISVIAFIAITNLWIIADTQKYVIEDSRELIGAEVGLVFGTSHKLVNGEANPFFQNRIATAKELLLSGKVEKLVLSGSKDSIYYDEAETMKKMLNQAGIGDEYLILDKYGNRTLESLSRLRDVHGYTQCILITQKYHAYRCIFIARRLGIDVQCYVAKTPDLQTHLKAILREIFARSKAVIDLFIL